MAIHHGIAVTKDETGKFTWFLGTSRWEFRQWPNEGLWRDGEQYTLPAMTDQIRMVEEAVVYSLGFEVGHRKGRYTVLDDILENK